MMHFTSVLFPAPFSPSSAWKVPGAILKETFSFATKEPKRFHTFTSSSGGGVCRTLASMRRGGGGDFAMRAFGAASRSGAERARSAGEAALVAARGDHHGEGQEVRRGVEEIVVAADADRLERGSERLCAAEKHRGPKALHGIPAREDDQRHGHEALPAGDELGPA